MKWRKIEGMILTPFGANRIATDAGTPVRLIFHNAEKHKRVWVKSCIIDNRRIQL
jgi:hypothetical protein